MHIKDVPAVGQHYAIRRIISEDPAWRLRLLAMGVRPGLKVKVMAKAPSGDPVLLSVAGQSCAVRWREWCGAVDWVGCS